MVDIYYFCKYVLSKNHVGSRVGYLKKYPGETGAV